MPEKNRGGDARVRSFWSGTITFGLVTIPVDLFAAVRARRTAMKMVDAKGKPLGRQYYCPKHDKKLSADEIVRGYETDKGKMIVISDEELEAAAPEMSRDIELQRFVPLEQIPPTYYQRPYFLAPSGRSTKAYHLLAQTMERAKRVGIGTFVMRGHEYLVAILSEGGLLRAETLRFADELRTPKDVGLPKAQKAAAGKVTAYAKAIAALTRDALDMDEVSDRYYEAIHALVEKKEQKREDVIDISAKAEDEEQEAGDNVVDLVQLLRKRMAAKATVTTADAASVASGSSEGSLGELSKTDLYERAQALDIPGRSKMGKKALVTAIRKAG